MQNYWSSRSLLICRYLLLTEQDTTNVLTPEDLFFNWKYPDATFLWQEPLQVLECLILLEQAGYVQLTDIKISPDYFSIYKPDREAEYPGLSEKAQQLNFGLSSSVFEKVQKGLNLTTDELSTSLQYDPTPKEGEVVGPSRIPIKVTDLAGDEVIAGLLATDNMEQFMRSLFETPTDLEGFKQYYINYHLTFPIVIAKHTSFVVRINRPRLAAGLNEYLAECRTGKVRGVTKRYFSYDVQKQVMTAALTELAQKQGASGVLWDIGYWDNKQGVSYEHSEHDDEFLRVLKRDYPDYYEAWQSKGSDFEHQYNFRFYETLFCLEQEGLISITGIRSEVRGTLDYAGDMMLGDGLQVITSLAANMDIEVSRGDGVNTRDIPPVSEAAPRLIFDPLNKKFQYGDKVMWVRQSEHSLPVRLNICLLMFRYPVCDASHAGEVTDITSQYPSYELGAEVQYDALHTLIYERRQETAGPQGDMFRPIRDAIAGLNKRAEKQLGVTIFYQQNQVVRVII